jgi:hypothetical protein
MIRPTKQLNIPGDLNIQQHRCEYSATPLWIFSNTAVNMQQHRCENLKSCNSERTYTVRKNVCLLYALRIEISRRKLHF